MAIWKSLGNVTVLSSVVIFLVAAGAAVRQWIESPIAIMPFTIVQDPQTAGLSAATLFDLTKADISTIYAESGDLFEKRKLGEPTVPLEVKIGSTGWSLQAITTALGIQLTSAIVIARLEREDGRLVLRWTTDKASDIRVDKLPVAELPGATSGSPPTSVDAAVGADVDRAVACLALRTVAGISPDVAANYLHKRAESAGGAHDGKPRDECITVGDEELYSEVSTDETQPPAARVNALVGLSVHYSYAHELFEELNMAQAATSMAARLLACDDTAALPTHWQRLKCSATAFQPFNDKNRRAQIAAWMQLGMAWSDYAAAAPTVNEMLQRRQYAIDAYEHVIALKPNYALAHDAKGLQHSLRNETDQAKVAYQHSLESAENSPAHLDLGLLFLHGRNDFLGETALTDVELDRAEAELRRAIDLNPTYWDAHALLGYVLYRSRRHQDAADVLEAALQHVDTNRRARLLLGAVYAAQCRFGSAHALFKDAYADRRVATEAAERQNVLADWGRVLDRFGEPVWAMQQETAVLEQNPAHVDALRIRGEIMLKWAGESPDEIQSGLADLKSAVDDDAAKDDVNLNAYLAALLRAGRPAEAVQIYEEWIQAGFVPPMATNTGIDPVILPSVPNVRLTFAKALAAAGRLDEATHEFAVLARLGVAPVEPADASRTAQRALRGLNAVAMNRVSDVGDRAASKAGALPGTGECGNRPIESPQINDAPPLMTGMVSPPPHD